MLLPDPDLQEYRDRVKVENQKIWFDSLTEKEQKAYTSTKDSFHRRRWRRANNNRSVRDTMDSSKTKPGGMIDWDEKDIRAKIKELLPKSAKDGMPTHQ